MLERVPKNFKYLNKQVKIGNNTSQVEDSANLANNLAKNGANKVSPAAVADNCASAGCRIGAKDDAGFARAGPVHSFAQPSTQTLAEWRRTSGLPSCRRN